MEEGPEGMRAAGQAEAVNWFETDHIGPDWRILHALTRYLEIHQDESKFLEDSGDPAQAIARAAFAWMNDVPRERLRPEDDFWWIVGVGGDDYRLQSRDFLLGFLEGISARWRAIKARL